MSITSALNSAMTGLTAAGRSTSVVSENLSNVLTPGYSRRSLALTSAGDGFSGVKVGHVQRINDPALQSSVRSANSEVGVAEVKSAFFGRMTELVGSADDPYSITQRLTDFDSGLIEVISRPDSGPRLNDLAIQAEELVRSIADAAEGLRNQRTAADRAIDVQVDTVNQSLEKLQKLNAKIAISQSTGSDSASLLDQRDLLIDEVNKIIPVKVVNRDRGQVALFSEGGAVLLDGQAAELSFDGKADTLPYMTLGNGLLSGLQIKGIDVATGPGGPIRGGTLAAQFEVRDVLTVEAQEDLDAMAKDLIERFQDPALDPTLTATDPGIFTDQGAFFDPANTVGIANRIELNDKIAMQGQAETWRLRDGLNAASPGNAGDATLLRGYADALDAKRTVSSVGLGTANLDASTLSANLLSRFAQSENSAEQNVAFAAATYTEMYQRELAQGVDSDAELQNLIVIEKVYQANARMISVVDELMETLLRI
ncbi:flagellar hook-associated protein FlgK [Phaeobacter inhibens]|uniref:flagellar hook-associated protein FlgK n=1 Tax=Phaeobacter inhibens TaxID=221822 RepID=UPI0021A5B4D7|nr:flagellar hook-associated protein FlgK [Phaeobacter inhibens]UWR76303.1 flagellar hook-associated protein FlgK [Phaeobacter inhibens]